MEYLFGLAGQEADVLDFANYVFSYSHRPHDFSTLWPKVYAREGFAPLHALAMEEGRIRGLAALLPQTLRISSEISLSCGFVGTVGVHPYARGQGIMQHLMAMLEEKGNQQGMDMLLLGGRRHRYNYFGYERGGSEIVLTFNKDCLHHAMKDVDAEGIAFSLLKDASSDQVDKAYVQNKKLCMVADRKREDFLSVLSGGFQTPQLVSRGEQVVGYLDVSERGIISEMGLPLDSVLPVLKAWLMEKGEAKVVVPQHAVQMLELLHPCAENYSVDDGAMIKVLNWPRVLAALMGFKHTWMPLADHQVVVEIEAAGRYLLKVKDGEVSVAPSDLPPDISLQHNQAVSLLFSPLSLFKSEKELFANWLPLPLNISLADWF